MIPWDSDLHELHRTVEGRFPELCDDTVLCIQLGGRNASRLYVCRRGRSRVYAAYWMSQEVQQADANQRSNQKGL